MIFRTNKNLLKEIRVKNAALKENIQELEVLKLEVQNLEQQGVEDRYFKNLYNRSRAELSELKNRNIVQYKALEVIEAAISFHCDNKKENDVSTRVVRTFIDKFFKLCIVDLEAIEAGEDDKDE